jgi:hypothetical protein
MLPPLNEIELKKTLKKKQNLKFETVKTLYMLLQDVSLLPRYNAFKSKTINELLDHNKEIKFSSPQLEGQTIEEIVNAGIISLCKNSSISALKIKGLIELFGAFLKVQNVHIHNEKKITGKRSTTLSLEIEDAPVPQNTFDTIKLDLFTSLPKGCVLNSIDAEQLIKNAVQYLRTMKSYNTIKEHTVGSYWINKEIKAPFEEAFTLKQLESLSVDSLLKKKSFGNDKIVAFINALRNCIQQEKARESIILDIFSKDTVEETSDVSEKSFSLSDTHPFINPSIQKKDEKRSLRLSPHVKKGEKRSLLLHTGKKQFKTKSPLVSSKNKHIYLHPGESGKKDQFQILEHTKVTKKQSERREFNAQEQGKWRPSFKTASLTLEMILCIACEESRRAIESLQPIGIFICSIQHILTADEFVVTWLTANEGLSLTEEIFVENDAQFESLYTSGFEKIRYFLSCELESFYKNLTALISVPAFRLGDVTQFYIDTMLNHSFQQGIAKMIFFALGARKIDFTPASGEIYWTGNPGLFESLSLLNNKASIKNESFIKLLESIFFGMDDEDRNELLKIKKLD